METQKEKFLGVREMSPYEMREVGGGWAWSPLVTWLIIDAIQNWDRYSEAFKEGFESTQNK
jgi:hypothetical protein